MNIDDETFACPVCKELMILPRFFPCGHSLCSECHRRVDRAARDKNTYARCPLCRAVTSVGWNSRPMNSALHKIMQQVYGQKYAERAAKVTVDFDGEDKEEKVDFDADYGRRAYSERMRMAIDLYHRILKMVAFAAKNGIPTVTVRDVDICRDSVKCLDILSYLLFSNNVYKVSYSQALKELCVHLNDLPVRPYYVNTEFSVGSVAAAATEAKAATSPSLPPPPPPPVESPPHRNPPGSWTVK